MLQIYNKYGQLKVVSSTSSTGVSSVSAVSPLTSTGGSNPIISSLITSSKLLGRHSVTTGAMQEITLGTGLFLSGSTLNVTTSLYTFTSPLVNTLGTVSINQATSTTNGYLSSVDWVTFNNKVTSLSAGIGISIAGTTTIPIVTNTAPDQTVVLNSGTGISISGTYPNFTITNISPSSGGTVTSVAALTLGTTGTDLSSTVVNETTTPVITLNVPTASATNRGVLSSTDWTTFNNKQDALGYIPLPTTAGSTTGATISFITDRVYGTIASPVTGNITADVTGGQLGVTNIIIHNSGTAPTFGSEFKKLSGSGNYVVSVVNYIYCTYITSTEIIYSINQRT
jgi:hypothetical protein